MGKAWREANPEKCREGKLRHYQANREAICRNRREYAKVNSEKETAYRKEYYVKNHSLILMKAALYAAANPEKKKASYAAWAGRNADRCRARANKRRAARLGSREGGFTRDDIRALLTSQEGKCVYCSSLLEADYHVDHVTPLSRGGLDNAENIAIACSSCNLSKGSKLFGYEWCPCIKGRRGPDCLLIFN